MVFPYPQRLPGFFQFKLNVQEVHRIPAHKHLVFAGLRLPIAGRVVLAGRSSTMSCSNRM